MKTEQTLAARLQVEEDRIDWVLSHPGTSHWLEHALRTALDRNPVDVLNDLEILNTILRPRSQALIDRMTTASESRSPDS